jgi:nitrogen fixation protein FixH
MSLFQTLFGGALLIVVLYYLLRLFGVSNYWRGVISGIVPVIAYMGSSIAHWPGGDVISMHMAVYLATATVLTVIGGRKPGMAKTLHWGPKVIIGFFLVLFVIDGALLMISGQGVPPVVAKWFLPPAKKTAQVPHTAFSGVVPHGEEAAKTINQFMASANRQDKLGWDVSLTGLDRLSMGSQVSVTLTAKGPDGQPLRGASSVLALLRPGLAQPEQMLDLVETDPGVYRGELILSLPGLWVAAVRLQRANDRYEMQQHIEVPAEKHASTLPRKEN